MPPTHHEAHDESKRRKTRFIALFIIRFFFGVDFDKHSAVKRPCYHRMIHQSLTTMKVRDILLDFYDVLSLTLEYANIFAFSVVKLVEGSSKKTPKITLHVSKTAEHKPEKLTNLVKHQMAKKSV
jgi:hypothetical protein